MAKAVRHPKVEVQLTGHTGNAFYILGVVQRALREAGVPADEVTEYINEATEGDYSHLLATTMSWVTVH